MSKLVVFVIGATGYVGSATVQVLAEKYGSKVEIRAGVRNPDKADKLKAISGVSVVKAEMGTTELKNTLKGVDCLLIVIPAVENRAELAISTAKLAKEAGVKHQVVVSGLTADLKDTLFGGQCNQIETAVKALRVTYTFLRLPFFFEFYFGFKDTIRNVGAIYAPMDPSKTFSQVSVGDIGRAAAAILVNPVKHPNKTYDIVSDCRSYREVAAVLSEVLGKTVTYNRVPYDSTKQALLGEGRPEWQVDGLIESFKLVDSGSSIANTANVSDFILITSEQPTSLKAWVAEVKGAFE